MQTKTHGQYLTQLTRLRFVNMYLVEEEDGLTLIDTGLAGGGKALVQAASQLRQPLRRVTLTHAHGDHAGSVDELRQALPDAEFIYSRRTANFLSGEMDLMPYEAQVPLRGSYVTAQTTADRLVTPGDRVGSLRVVAAPGHSPDLVAFLDERDGTLIAGDAFQTMGGVAVSGVVRWRFPVIAYATWHLPTAAQSARSLLDLKPARLAVGHGRVLESPAAAMAAAIAEAERKVHGQAAAA